MPPSRTVAPYSPAWTPRASRRSQGHGRHLGPFIRDTNLLERSLAEVKRRTKVIGRFPGETSCLTLVWAVLDLYITHAKNGVRFSQLERQHLRRIRHAGSEQAAGIIGGWRWWTVLMISALSIPCR
jgi:transposase-like protein